MLQSMLEFNPFFRKKPEEYLKLDVFKSLRTNNPEMLVPPPELIKLEVDQKKAFDYENSKFMNKTVEELKNDLKQEIEKIKNLNLLNVIHESQNLIWRAEIINFIITLWN